MSTQIIYIDNTVPVTSASLAWPTSYTTSSGKTAHLPNPSIPIKYGYKTNTLVTEFESGHEQRRSKGLTKKTFEFTYKALTLEEADVIEAFFFECLGSVRAFSWTDPVDKKVYVCRFDGDSFAREYFRHGANGPIFRIPVKLTQVL